MERKGTQKAVNKNLLKSNEEWIDKSRRFRSQLTSGLMASWFYGFIVERAVDSKSMRQWNPEAIKPRQS